MSEELFALTFELSPAMMTISRIADGVLIKVNQQFEACLGYSAAEVLGHSSSDLGIFMSPESRANIGQQLSNRGFIRDIEIKLRTKPGIIITVLASMAQIVLEGTPCFLTVLYDISERKLSEKKLHESQQLFANAFELSPSMMSIYRQRDGQYLNINASFEHGTGYTREEVIGKTSLDIRLPVHTEERQKILQSINEKGRYDDFEIQLRHKSGAIIDILGSAQVVEFNGESCILSVFFDVTERKLTNKLLSQKIAELDEFTFISSHDLQEPLRKMVAYSELLKTDIAVELSDKAQADLSFIMEAGYRMQSLIRDLLDFSKMGRREMVYHNCKLDECLDAALENVAPIIEEMHAVIEREPLPEVFGDRAMLIQLFFHLLSNALKFVETGKVPLIHITTQTSDNVSIVEISDNGIGIDPKYHLQIFAPFKRLHGRDEYGGSGIGLALCKKIVERHGGIIWLKSAPNNGSSFIFSLSNIRKP